MNDGFKIEKTVNRVDGVNIHGIRLTIPGPLSDAEREGITAAASVNPMMLIDQIKRREKI